MFIQVVTGTVTDIGGYRKQDQRWNDEIKPGAIGFLGGTSGTTDDNRFIVVARFESADAAKRNSERPEQAAWFAEMEKFVDNVAFHNCNKIMTLFGGGSDDATFVQVMQGHVTDADKLAALEPRFPDFEPVFRAARPDVIGELIAYHDDGGGYTDVVYFTSEADARANEQKPMPAEAQKLFDELMSAIAVDEYLDLKDPDLR